MNVAFVTGSVDEGDFLSRVAKALESWGIVSHFICTRRHVWRRLAPSHTGRVHFHGYRVRASDDDIARCLREYAGTNLSLLVFSDPVLRRMDRREAMAVLAWYLDFWERMLSQHDMALVAHYPTAHVLGRSAHAACKRRGVRHWVFQTGPMVDRNFTICDLDENWLWSEFVQRYDGGQAQVDDGARTQIDELVRKVLETKQRSTRIRAVTLKTLLGFAYRSLRYGRTDAIEWNELRKLLTAFGRRLPLLTFRYDQPQPGERYIFFPLHIPWDAQIATRNPMFANQPYLVEMLSRCLPYGCWLYAKEHPYNYGGERLSVLKRMKRLPNVKLIHPKVSSVDLIADATAVAVINSTAGWEGILLKKPVISFGRTFYAHFKHTFTVDYLGQLPDLVQKVFAEPQPQDEGHQAEWERFVWSVLSTAHPGAIVSYKNYMGLGRAPTEEHVRGVARSLVRKLHG